MKAGDVVAEFDPTNQLQRLDDYKDSVVQQENTVKKMMANLAATKEAHDQTVAPPRPIGIRPFSTSRPRKSASAIDAEKFKLTVEENEAKYKQLVAESALVDESQRAAIRISRTESRPVQDRIAARRESTCRDDHQGADGRHRGA